MVANDEVDSGVHWYWGSGVGFAIIFMAILDLTHHNLAPGQARIARVRFTVSYLALPSSFLDRKLIASRSSNRLFVLFSLFVLVCL